MYPIAKNDERNLLITIPRAIVNTGSTVDAHCTINKMTVIK